MPAALLPTHCSSCLPATLSRLIIPILSGDDRRQSSVVGGRNEAAPRLDGSGVPPRAVWSLRGRDSHRGALHLALLDGVRGACPQLVPWQQVDLVDIRP